jgi:hypothetical protein
MPDSGTIEIAFAIELTTDPLGATLSVSVEDALSAESTRKFLDRTQRTLVGVENNLVFQAVQQAHDQLNTYGSEHGYHVETIIDSFAGVDVDRSSSRIDVSWHWTHEAASYMEFGTSDHTVDGNPLLVFAFSESEYPGLAEAFPDGTAFLPEVEVSGLPEGRWVRDSLTWFRREVSQA